MFSGATEPGEGSPAGSERNFDGPNVIGLEDGFWESRESLTIIYEAALIRMCSPWAVLAFCAARALSLVRATTTLPAPIAGRGSLNWFAAIAATSGGGKSGAEAVASDLMSRWVFTRNLGSGEGLVTAYLDFGNKDEDGLPAQREQVMCVADEIDTLAALSARGGSMLLPNLRSAFTGGMLGYSHATKGRDVHLAAHTYRLTFVCSVQPARAATILGDDGGGTPQRFMWFPGTDGRISRKTRDELICRMNTTAFGGLGLLGGDNYPREVILPVEATELILDQRERQARGAADPLDGHAIFAREKFAYALGVLDGRREMTSEEWRLSGIAFDVSKATRDWVAAGLAEAQRREVSAAGELIGIRSAAAEQMKASETIDAVHRIKARALNLIDDAGAGGLKHRDLWSKIAKRDRGLLADVMKVLAADGIITKDAQGRWRRV